MALNISDPAPQIPGIDFSQGWTLVYFYPADFTPGCTTEACNFRDDFSVLKEKVRIVGVSSDSAESHNDFKAKYDLPFELISDPDKLIINAYGANGLIFTKRVSFLIDPSGKISKIYNQVNPQTHSAEILKDLP